MRSRLLLALIFIGVSFPLVVFSQDREPSEYFLSFHDDCENSGFRLKEFSDERPACSIVDFSTRDTAAASDDDDGLVIKFGRSTWLSESESAYFSSEEEGNVTVKCGNLRCACALRKKNIDGAFVYYLVDEDVTYQQATVNNFNQI